MLYLLQQTTFIWTISRTFIFMLHVYTHAIQYKQVNVWIDKVQAIMAARSVRLMRRTEAVQYTDYMSLYVCVCVCVCACALHNFAHANIYFEPESAGCPVHSLRLGTSPKRVKPYCRLINPCGRPFFFLKRHRWAFRQHNSGHTWPCDTCVVCQCDVSLVKVGNSVGEVYIYIYICLNNCS